MPEPGREPTDVTPEPLAPEAGSRSPVRRIALIALLVVVVIALATLAWSYWPVFAEKDATITVPPRVAGAPLDTGAGTTDTIDYLRTAVAANVELDKTVGGIYRDSQGRDIIFVGGTGLIWAPDRELESAFGLVADEEGAVTGVTDVAPGSLGGSMRCGTTKTDEGALTVCGWADHGSLGLAMFSNRSPSDAGKVLLELRNAAEKRH